MIHLWNWLIKMIRSFFLSSLKIVAATTYYPMIPSSYTSDYVVFAFQFFSSPLQTCSVDTDPCPYAFIAESDLRFAIMIRPLDIVGLNLQSSCWNLFEQRANSLCQRLSWWYISSGWYMTILIGSIPHFLSMTVIVTGVKNDVWSHASTSCPKTSDWKK